MRDLDEAGSSLIAANNAATDCDMNSAGEVGAENGLPDARVWPSVEMITICRVPAVIRDCWRAERRSEEDVGVPFWIVRLALVIVEREDGSRARAVIV